jgi:hypothetical protein
MSSQPDSAGNGNAQLRTQAHGRSHQVLNQPRQLRLMVAVKAYPSISTTYDELVCCAGITEAHEWVRLYPVPYRDLPGQKQFEKGDIIEVLVERREAHKDDRPESWRPRLDTMRITGNVPVNDNWRSRLSWIAPTVLPGFGELLLKQQSENKSLGAFRLNKILGVKVKPDTRTWTSAQMATINQKDLFSEKQPLEKVPFRFQLGFEDEAGAKHWLSVIDWEFFQLWRKERDRFHDENKAAEQVKKKLEWITAGDKDVIAFAGNLGDPRMRRSFMILGFCYPKMELQRTLL